MTLILKQVFAFFKLLNSDKGTVSISIGIALGFVLGMSPLFSLQSILIFFCMFFFRVQIGAALISSFFFAFVAYLLDPLFHQIGKAVLSAPPLYGVFETLYHLPIIPFTRFNNTVVMGSGVLAVALTPVIYLLAKKLVDRYREAVVARFQNSKFFKAFKLTGFYKWYLKYDSIFG